MSHFNIGEQFSAIFIQILFGSIGLLGNLLCWLKFSRRSLACFHHLMLSLAVFDSLYIITAMLLFGVPAIYAELVQCSTYYKFYFSFSHPICNPIRGKIICRIRGEEWYAHLVPILLPLAQIGLTGSIYLTVSISVERYVTVVHPFFKVVLSFF